MSDYITVENINHINAELSNFCNSACPMCPRYDSDLNLIKDISNNSHTTLSEIQNKIGEKVISQLNKNVHIHGKRLSELCLNRPKKDLSKEKR